MITMRRSGMYKLIETKRHTKILYLNDQAFAWVEPPTIGEILVTTHSTHKTDCVLSVGYFRYYEVDDEPNLSDQVHLELEVGENQWQGYLLLSGLPNDTKKRGRIIPTSEIITSNPKFIGKLNTSDAAY